MTTETNETPHTQYVQASVDTPVMGFPRYFRYNEETKLYEINAQIDPRVNAEDWQTVPGTIRDLFCEPRESVPLGNIIYRLARSEWRSLERQDKHMEEINKAHRAIEIIGERLIQEAERRGWCDEFDSIIDDVNAELPGSFALPTREREYEVEIEVEATVTFTHTVTVTARNEDEARDNVEYDLNAYFDPDDAASDHVSYNGFTDVSTDIVYVREQ